jgi:hypothetical protein
MFAGYSQKVEEFVVKLKFVHNLITTLLQFNLYSRHVILSGSGAQDYVSFMCLMALVMLTV